MPYTLEIPPFGALSPEQARAVTHSGAIRLAGGPGTGKSLVSLWRALDETSGEKVLILTYTLSLEFYFRKMLASARKKGETKNIRIQRSQKTAYNQETMLNGHWDEIILDEAQDMKLSHVELFKRHADRVSFGADYRQQLYPEKGISEGMLTQTIDVSRKFELSRNYRSTKQILKAVRAFFPDRSLPADVIEKSKTGPTVELRLCDKWDEVNVAHSVLREIVSVSPGNIAILVPSENKVDEVYNSVKDVLNGDVTKYSSRDNLDELSEMGRVHVCTYKSSKGLEWDVVILPYFGGRDWWIQSDLLDVNDHYVAMTRAKIQLWLLSDNYRDQSIIDRAYGQEKPEGRSIGGTGFQGPTSIGTTTEDDLPF